MKTILLLLLATTIISCNNTMSPHSALDSIAIDTSTVETETDSSLDSLYKWSYSETEDKMTSKKTLIASVMSTTTLDFDFPYDGGAYAYLSIRKKRGDTDVFLQVSKGQFNSSYDGGNVRIRFDKTPASTYSFSGASSGNNDIIFIDNTQRFIANLKKHDKLLIEAEFFSEGYKTMEFDISNLKWN